MMNFFIHVPLIRRTYYTHRVGSFALNMLEENNFDVNIADFNYKVIEQLVNSKQRRFDFVNKRV